MNPEFITFIWLATFENQAKLNSYVNWDYSEDQDAPKCRFADDIGLQWFDHDFLEISFAATPSKILEKIDYISFVENYKDQLLTKIADINYSERNSIISLSGKKDTYGGINEPLFGFVPTINSKSYLEFIGPFKYEIHN